MKLALWLTAAVLALAAGCSVSHRSTDFACGPDQRCANGRTCVDGFCVVVADSGVVDTPQFGDAALCPSQCTSCNAAQKTCTIDCAFNNGACAQQVTCPSGWSCNVACSVVGQCNSGINCTNAKACTIACSARQTCKNVACETGACNITCSGPQSCTGALACGAGACNVNCSGTGACSGSVSCGASCACEVTCRLGATCGDVTCKQGCTGTTPTELCTSAASGCNTCP